MGDKEGYNYSGCSTRKHDFELHIEYLAAFVVATVSIDMDSNIFLQPAHILHPDKDWIAIRFFFSPPIVVLAVRNEPNYGRILCCVPIF